MAIQLNESNFKEEDTTRLFDNGNPSEYDVAIIDDKKEQHPERGSNKSQKGT